MRRNVTSKLDEKLLRRQFSVSGTPSSHTLFKASQAERNLYKARASKYAAKGDYPNAADNFELASESLSKIKKFQKGGVLNSGHQFAQNEESQLADDLRKQAPSPARIKKAVNYGATAKVKWPAGTAEDNNFMDTSETQQEVLARRKAAKNPKSRLWSGPQTKLAEFGVGVGVTLGLYQAFGNGQNASPEERLADLKRREALNDAEHPSFEADEKWAPGTRLPNHITGSGVGHGDLININGRVHRVIDTDEYTEPSNSNPSGKIFTAVPRLRGG